MKITTTLFRKPGRFPPKENKIPFKELFPLKLKNEVSAAGQKSADTSCLQEMAVMFACMKKNEFKEVLCAPEIDSFQTCYSQHRASITAAKEREKSGILVPGRNSRNLTTRQLNQLLNKYPQFNNNFKS